MNLEKIDAAVRPRHPWEAVDLGFGMVHRWWRPIAAAWLVTVVPAALLVALLFAGSPLTAFFVLWWLKSLFERVPLFVLSRALFGAAPTAREVLRELPRLWTAQLLGGLTIGRLDPARSLVASVGLLEGLRGGEHAKRAGLLREQDARPASWLTTVCLVFELLLVAGIFGLVPLVLPDNLAPDLGGHFEDLGNARAPLWFYAFSLGSCVLATSLVTPFYVAGGFALYLNRRTLLEGWDVELTFKRLARRLQDDRRTPASRRRTAAAVLLLLSFLPAPPASAQETGDPQQAVREVLTDATFGGERTERVWRLRYLPEMPEPQREVERAPSAAPMIVGGLLQIVFIAVLALAAVALIVFVLARWRGREVLPSELPSAPVDVTSALEADEEALPADVVAAARELWRSGRSVDALGLLHRGALDVLTRVFQLPLEESWTEEDCVAQVRRHASSALLGGARRGGAMADYFGRLTDAWQSTAYAHRPPSAEEAEELFNGWRRCFRPALGEMREAA